MHWESRCCKCVLGYMVQESFGSIRLGFGQDMVALHMVTVTRDDAGSWFGWDVDTIRRPIR